MAHSATTARAGMAFHNASLFHRIRFVPPDAPVHRLRGRHTPPTLVRDIEMVCLPPYSPDLNPIERLWQHLKSHQNAGFIIKDGNALGERIFQPVRWLPQTSETIRSE